jgi:membrane protein implicated in regulation of membrane protease activity
VAVIVLVFLLLWGTTGLVAHAYLRSRLAENGSWFWLSLAITLVVAVCGTGLIVRAVARIMPTNQSYGSSTRDLIGRGAEVLFEVGAKAGTVRLTDQFKNTLDFKARAQVGTGPL